jgi:hypothetical protein
VRSIRSLSGEFNQPKSHIQSTHNHEHLATIHQDREPGPCRSHLGARLQHRPRRALDVSGGSPLRRKLPPIHPCLRRKGVRVRHGGPHTVLTGANTVRIPLGSPLPFSEGNGFNKASTAEVEDPVRLATIGKHWHILPRQCAIFCQLISRLLSGASSISNVSAPPSRQMGRAPHSTTAHEARSSQPVLEQHQRRLLGSPALATWPTLHITRPSGQSRVVPANQCRIGS